MSTRVRTVGFAVAFGLLATISAAFYMSSLRAEIVESGVKNAVLVAKAPVPAGTPAADLVANDLVQILEMPKRYAAEGAVGDLEGYEGRVLSVALGAGEQLTAAKFRSESESGLTQRLRDGKIAVALPVDEVVGVGGSIRGGDKIVIMATFEPGPGGSDISRVLLRDIEVLAVAGYGEDPAQGGLDANRQIKKTITVAVNPPDAEKLVFAEEKGKVWLGLAGSVADPAPATGGQTMESIFK